jgi:hypothetical protein
MEDTWVWVRASVQLGEAELKTALAPQQGCQKQQWLAPST